MKVICKGCKTCFSKKDCSHAKPHKYGSSCESINLPDDCTCSNIFLLKKLRLKKLKKLKKLDM